VIIRQLNRVSAGAAAQDGGSGAAVITVERAGPGRASRTRRRVEPVQLEFSRRTGEDGGQVITVVGELDIATAEQAYAYISEVIDAGQAPVSVDLAGLTFCDASGLGVLARVANHARQAGRQFRLTSARPPLLKIMRLTGLDRSFPELGSSARAY
jgi:anti-sigma B factor antagonist